MTNREFFTAVAALENIDPALVEHAQTALVKMDETNAKRKEKAKETDATAKWAEENAELIENAFAELGTDVKNQIGHRARALMELERELTCYQKNE